MADIIDVGDVEEHRLPVIIDTYKNRYGNHSIRDALTVSLIIGLLGKVALGSKPLAICEGQMPVLAANLGGR